MIHSSVWAVLSGEPALELRIKQLPTGELNLETQFLGRFAAIGLLSGPLGALTPKVTPKYMPAAFDLAVTRVGGKLGLTRVRSDEFEASAIQQAMAMRIDPKTR